MEIINLPIDELTPYSKNAKKHPKKQILRIANSIEQFGMNDPIAIWGEKNIIVEGHGRYLALKELGYDSVPCIRLDDLTDEERRAYTLAHNKVAESEWDFNLLDEEFESIDIDMEQFGFEMFSMDDIDELNGYNKHEDDREHFSKTFTFPIEKKQQIICYLKKHQNEIVERIIRESENDD